MSSAVFGEFKIATYAPGRRDMSIKKNQCVDSKLGTLNLNYGGLFRLAGTTAVSGTPDVKVSREVILFDKRTRRPISRRISDADGNYEFSASLKGPWFIVSFEPTGEFNAVIADNAFGEPM